MRSKRSRSLTASPPGFRETASATASSRAGRRLIGALRVLIRAARESSDAAVSANPAIRSRRRVTRWSQADRQIRCRGTRSWSPPGGRDDPVSSQATPGRGPSRSANRTLSGLADAWRASSIAARTRGWAAVEHIAVAQIPRIADHHFPAVAVVLRQLLRCPGDMKMTRPGHSERSNGDADRPRNPRPAARDRRPAPPIRPAVRRVLAENGAERVVEPLLDKFCRARLFRVELVPLRLYILSLRPCSSCVTSSTERAWS